MRVRDQRRNTANDTKQEFEEKLVLVLNFWLISVVIFIQEIESYELSCSNLITKAPDTKKKIAVPSEDRQSSDDPMTFE